MDPNNGPTQAPPAVPSGGKLGFLKNNNKKKLVGIIAAAVIVLGGSAGAYYGYYLPNQPQNILKKSVSDLLKKDQISGNGKMNFSSKNEDGSNAAGTVDYSLQTDMPKNTFGGKFDIAYSGVKLPVEVRGVDKAACSQAKASKQPDNHSWVILF